MFRWFENRLDPFPAAELSEPPRKLLPFCMHFTRGAWPYIILAAILTAGIALTEVWLFAFLGNIVDWLSGQSRETFLQNEGWKLVGMAPVSYKHLRAHETVLDLVYRLRLEKKETDKS